MSPFPGGRVSPGHFVPAAGGLVFDVAIDNSSVEGILSFGGFPFPMAAVCQQPNLQIRTRGDSGDQIIDDTVTASTAGVNVFLVSGTNFDQGGRGYDTDGFPIGVTSFCSHGRWIAAAGVARTVSRVTQINILDPTQTFVIETYVYSITARFSG